MPRVRIVSPVDLEMDVQSGASLMDLAASCQGSFRTRILAAKVDHNLQELTGTVERDCTIEFLDLTHPDGNRIYERGIVFLLVMAARELLPNCRVTIEHHISNGLYGELYCDCPVTTKEIERLEARMRELISADLPFGKSLVSRDEAIGIFTGDGQPDKVRLLRTGKREQVKVYRCDWCHDSFYGYMVPSTGYLDKFRIKSYMPGFLLQIPDTKDPDRIPEYVEQKKLATVFHEAEKWGTILGIDDVGQLNEHVGSGLGGDLIRVAEALHEKKIAQIADAIHSEKERLRIILIAGPSSSGKTTFAQRLSVQLRVNGLKPISISLDDYFVSRNDTPLDEEGQPDFEALEAIDLELFNEDLQRLVQGDTVELPTFNFISGSREFRGRKLSIGEDQPIIIEGIHGLNDRLTSSIPGSKKFHVYVSALTALNLDDHNRIPTTDVRLLRRIVRDNRFRSHNAHQTIAMWPSVRRGERRNIFPYQENADVMFNSALVYELAVLKHYAEPLLAGVPYNTPEYSEAKRLLKFLEYFMPMDDCEVPGNSIMKEFVGGSCFA